MRAANKATIPKKRFASNVTRFDVTKVAASQKTEKLEATSEKARSWYFVGTTE